MGALLIFIPQYNLVLLDITVMLYSLLANIFSQDEDPADSVPSDGLEGSNFNCMIL